MKGPSFAKATTSRYCLSLSRCSSANEPYAMRAESELPPEYRTLAKVRMHLRPRLKPRTAVPLPG